MKVAVYVKSFSTLNFCECSLPPVVVIFGNVPSAKSGEVPTSDLLDEILSYLYPQMASSLVAMLNITELFVTIEPFNGDTSEIIGGVVSRTLVTAKLFVPLVGSLPTLPEVSVALA